MRRHLPIGAAVRRGRIGHPVAPRLPGNDLAPGRRALLVLATLLVSAAACGPGSEPLGPEAGFDPVGPAGPPGDNEPPAGGSPPDDPTQGPVTYDFGAKFEPPSGRVVHAQGQWQAYNDKYLALLPSDAQPASELAFFSIGDTPRGWDPGQIAALLQAQRVAGRIPHIDVALRGLQPAPDSLAKLPDPYYAIDHEVAHGTTYDGRIADLIQVVKAFAGPVMMRIGGEFNGPWNGYHPYDYPKAFRKIVTMFRDAGVHNVAFIWCYEPAAPADFAEQNAQGEYRWYPGDDVVDWFSVDLFASADVWAEADGNRVGVPPYERVIAFLDMAVTAGKPVIIAESSPSHYDFGHPADAEAAWTEWFEPFFALIAGRPEIKWFHYINYDWTQASHYAGLGWKNNDLSASLLLSERYVQEISQPKFLHSDERHLLNQYINYP